MNVKYGIQNEFRIFYLIHCRTRKMGMTKKNQVMPDKVLSKEFEEDRIGIFYKRPPYNWGKSNCEPEHLSVPVPFHNNTCTYPKEKPNWSSS